MMKFKMLAGLIGLVAVLAFLTPPIIKMHSVALVVIILIGAGLAIYEFTETLRNKD